VFVAATSGFAAVAVTLVPESAEVVAWVAWPPAAYMLWVIDFFASLPFASIRLEGVGVGHAIALYAGLVALVVWLQGRDREEEQANPIPFRRLATVGALVIVVAAGLGISWLTWSGRDASRVSVTVLDVGQGDSILIEDLSGHRVLVDGGPGEQSLAEALGRHLPFHDRRIDMIVITHPQADHIGGLAEVADSYDVGSAVSRTGESEAGETLVEALISAGIPTTTPSAGQTIELDGARLEVLQAASDAEDVNDQSVVVKLTSGDVEFLLTGDLGKLGEEELLRSGALLEADVLKVGHHGSRFSSTPAFLERIGAQVSVISAGESNPYGHPAPEVLDRLSDTAIFRTDHDGDVTISTDGRRIWVDTER
jgi:competence protein ComEC